MAGMVLEGGEVRMYALCVGNVAATKSAKDKGFSRVFHGGEGRKKRALSRGGVLLGFLILFPDTDFLFRRYQPPAHLLRGAGALKMSLLPSPTPYTLSPLLEGGEGRGEGGSYTHVPCPFGALLVTSYHFKSKAFLM